MSKRKHPLAPARTRTALALSVACGDDVCTLVCAAATHFSDVPRVVECRLDNAAGLTEECFQQTPIPFGGKTWLEWSNGTRHPIEGRYLTAPGNTPPMSTWAMQPLPFSDAHTNVSFQPPCDEPVDRRTNDTGLCSGRFPWDVAIIDSLVVPKGLDPGEYVLGFRWDCEATAQIWQSCADIEIAA